MASSIVTPAMRCKAEQLAELFPTFSRGRSKRNGRQFVIVPGTERGTAHWTAADGLACTCAGFQRRNVCTHALAAQLVAERTAEAGGPARGQADRGLEAAPHLRRAVPAVRGAGCRRTPSERQVPRSPGAGGSMSILTMSPGSSWYEPSWLDDDDDQDDATPHPELLLNSWWSASTDLEDQD